MFLITGATGNVGRHLTGLLAAEGARVRAVTRDASKASFPAEIEVVEGDPSRPQTIAAALEGASGLFLNPAAVGDATAELLALGVDLTRVVMLSGLAVDDATVAIEKTVTSSGLEYTLLRPGMFATGALTLWADQIRAGDIIEGPYGKAAQAPIDPRDIAAVAAHALLTDDLVGGEPRLTGPESITQEDMVRVLGNAIGRPLRYREIPAETAKREMTAMGFPEPMVDDFLGILADSVGGEAVRTDEVRRILGRPARTYAQWAADHAGFFRD